MQVGTRATRCGRTSSKGHQGPIITHCSPFTSIMHNHPPLLQTFLFHTVPFSHHPSHSWPSSQSHTSQIGSYYSLHQLVLLHSLHVSKPPQHTLFCSTSQLSHINSSPLQLIFHSVHTRYSTHNPQTPHLHYIQSLLYYCHTPCFSPIQCNGHSYTSYNFLFTFILFTLQLNTFVILPNTFPTLLILDFTSLSIPPSTVIYSNI